MSTPTCSLKHKQMEKKVEKLDRSSDPHLRENFVLNKKWMKMIVSVTKIEKSKKFNEKNM